ncbi:conjugal transfer protein TraF [Shewanella fidelis]|uniref:Conjugal transfer protein TraF n=1 Tax=Shewanella fidelis TaxID=173509 RepID=A0AAW8NRD2_9GAMM|nr:conjugal transfer protein TraF [Shewanella fidelis]MDR8525282.1 conjugal transfer protein TraF [Shewanella fidelis]MDW4813681.1 conjugal transfer protein TraF [Shewanella fidelis]MDW4817661.1 conjugal transfer protein TraF [Shewanella fidelis]MDW4821728.1 conjugal transfer protein TraF [Shewanella fidelis]MDW4826009.1 conjugal transfer protein TraF [Shewanella fidelis]
MARKYLLAPTLIATLVSANSYAAVQSFDARSFAMGGIGASTADYLTATFHNPALTARYGEDDDVGVLIPSIGAQVDDSEEIIDKTEDFSDIYDRFSAITNPTEQDAQLVIDALEELQSNRANVQANVSLAVAIPNEYVSVNMFIKAYADAFIFADIAEDDLNTDKLIENGSLTSQALTMGVVIAEAGVSFAKSYQSSHGTFYYGITPKYQQVTTINYVTDIENYEFDDWDDDKYQTEESNINLDIGFAYHMNNGFAFGLVGKNLVKNSYETSATKGINGEYVINPTYIASASYNHRLFTVGVDVDLNEAEGYDSIAGTLNAVDTKADNKQMAGIGVEFNAFDWAQVRAGYQTDLSDNLADQFTAGLGLSPFDTFHIDLSASYASDNELGAVIQTSFTF